MRGLIRYAEKLFKGTDVSIEEYPEGCGFALTLGDDDEDKIYSVINSGYGSQHGLLESWRCDKDGEDVRGWRVPDAIRGDLRAYRKRHKIRPSLGD